MPTMPAIEKTKEALPMSRHCCMCAAAGVAVNDRTVQRRNAFFGTYRHAAMASRGESDWRNSHTSGLLLACKLTKVSSWLDGCF
jgi:hypothetical protein